MALTLPLLRRMLQNPRVIGVKNSSMAVYDISLFINEGAMVMNGPDEQLVPGLLTGATGGIGGTYGVMPELFIRARELALTGQVDAARALQADICRIIEKLCSGGCNMYAMIKEVLRQQGGPDIGDARPPLAGLTEPDKAVAACCVEMIAQTQAKY